MESSIAGDLALLAIIALPIGHALMASYRAWRDGAGW